MKWELSKFDRRRSEEFSPALIPCWNIDVKPLSEQWLCNFAIRIVHNTMSTHTYIHTSNASNYYTVVLITRITTVFISVPKCSTYIVDSLSLVHLLSLNVLIWMNHQQSPKWSFMKTFNRKFWFESAPCEL